MLETAITCSGVPIASAGYFNTIQVCEAKTVEEIEEIYESYFPDFP